MIYQNKPLEELFDLSSMKSALGKRVSEGIRISDIEAAFGETRHAPEKPVEAVLKIVFENHEPYLEKAFLLRKFFNTSSDASHPVVKNKVIRNLGYLLFAKEEWFNQNPELAKNMFPNQTFDDLFFKKRNDQVHLFMKKNPV